MRDRKKDSELNLASPAIYDEIDKSVEEGEWDGYHSGFPCSSFSRVRRRNSPGGNLLKCRPQLWAPGEFQGTAFELQVGSPGSGLRLFAALPKVALVTGCCSAITPTGNLTLVEATQVGLVWRMARRVVAAQSNERGRVRRRGPLA